MSSSEHSFKSRSDLWLAVVRDEGSNYPEVFGPFPTMKAAQEWGEGYKRDQKWPSPVAEVWYQAVTEPIGAVHA